MLHTEFIIAIDNIYKQNADLSKSLEMANNKLAETELKLQEAHQHIKELERILERSRHNISRSHNRELDEELER